MANVPQLGAPGADDDSQEMPTCSHCGHAIWSEHAVDCPAVNRKDPVCGEDHEVGSQPRSCFACLDDLCDSLLEVAQIEQALQMRGYTRATAKGIGREAEEAYLYGGVPGLNDWRRRKREFAIARAETRAQSERCHGRYPVPHRREEPFDVTYRCGLNKGHQGPHRAD